MKRADVIKTITDMGLRCRYIPETGEYRVAPNLGPLPGGRGFQQAYHEKEEAQAYYTNDKADAIGTAKQMVK